MLKSLPINQTIGLSEITSFLIMVSGQMTIEQVGAAIHPHSIQTELFGDMARRLSLRLKWAEKGASKKK